MGKTLQVPRSRAEAVRALVETADAWGEPLPAGLKKIAEALDKDDKQATQKAMRLERERELTTQRRNPRLRRTQGKAIKQRSVQLRSNEPPTRKPTAGLVQRPEERPSKSQAALEPGRRVLLWLRRRKLWDEVFTKTVANVVALIILVMIADAAGLIQISQNEWVKLYIATGVLVLFPLSGIWAVTFFIKRAKHSWQSTVLNGTLAAVLFFLVLIGGLLLLLLGTLPIRWS
jgi:hypothetical protein